MGYFYDRSSSFLYQQLGHLPLMKAIKKLISIDFAPLLLGLGYLLPIWVYIRNRSFFLDECNLARNIVEKPYHLLFSDLDYSQHAPPFFSLLTKFIVQVGGAHEYAFRLLPLLAILSSVFLFYKISQRWFSNRWIQYKAFSLFSFSYYILEYSTSFKQYALDVFFTCLFIYLSDRLTCSNWKNTLLLGLLGGIGLWFSMPLAFVLSGVGFAHLFTHYQSEKQFFAPNLVRTYFAIIIWTTSFIGLFFVNLRPSIGSAHLQQYHANYFLQFPLSIEAIQQDLSIWVGLFRNVVGRNTLPIIFAISCFCLGIFHLIKTNPSRLLLLLFPILSCFLASFLQMYSLLVRLVLFLLPIFILLIAIGIEKSIFHLNRYNKKTRLIGQSSIGVLIVLCLIGRSGIPYYNNPLPKNNPRAVLQQLEKTPHTNLPIYVTHFGTSSQMYYTRIHATKYDFPFGPVIHGHWSDNLIELVKDWKQKGWKQIWVYDSHTHDEELQRLEVQIQAIGTVKERHYARAAFAVLLELK